MVCVRMLDPSLPQFGRRAALIRTDESVERALRQRQRHIGPGRDVGDRMHEGDAPRNTGASGTANFEPIEIVERFNSQAMSTWPWISALVTFRSANSWPE